MTPKTANSKTDALTTTATTEHQELTPNELATIHGGSCRKAGGTPTESLTLTFSTIQFTYSS